MKDFRMEFVRCIVMTTLAMLKYLPAINTTAQIATQAERDEKGETLSYATLRLWKRVFERIANYHQQGVLEKI